MFRTLSERRILVRPLGERYANHLVDTLVMASATTVTTVMPGVWRYAGNLGQARSI